jgi:hypothetical protein
MRITGALASALLGALAGAPALYLVTAMGFTQAGARLGPTRGPGLVALVAGGASGGAAGYALWRWRR